MYRGKVSEGIEKAATTSDRTSHIGFLPDNESKTAEFISQRIKYLTGLDTRSGAAEPHQVVNYGLGGHYTVHLDVFVIKRPDMVEMMDNYGNRMATFLIYLSDVERGGSTAFPDADIVVSPEKGKAVFWYSYTPAGEIDLSTYHAGCPVVIGEKWIINKWIWINENIFNRRCGLKPTATQLDIERDMTSGYRPKRNIERDMTSGYRPKRNRKQIRRK
ncbi:Prolyl 4-hydroxylase subunit alpha-1 [Bulinus truncatus]|nr:Prolyl 4-hydroxylase subunit alpha-1 [Bulinus truncatus]